MVRANAAPASFSKLRALLFETTSRGIRELLGVRLTRDKRTCGPARF